MKLSDICRVAGGEKEDAFIGLQLCGEQPSITFPVGYVLPPESGLQEAVLQLMFVLERGIEYARQEGRLEELGVQGSVASTPLWAYLDLLRHYENTRCYYSVQQNTFAVRAEGKIDWRRTVRSQTPYGGSRGCYYPRYVTRLTMPDEESLVTLIHRYCVWQSYRLLGWLFGSTELPEEEPLPADAGVCIAALQRCLDTTHEDARKDLLRAMLCILEAPGEGEVQLSETYGISKFDVVWEMLVRACWGNVDEKMYFAGSRWYMVGEAKAVRPEPLRPDSIMHVDGSYFVLDAKYYRLHRKRSNLMNMPGTADVNKQITYASWVRANHAVEPIYNVFILPGSSGNLVPELAGWNVTDWQEDSLRRASVASPDCFYLVLAYRMDVRELMAHFVKSPRGSRSERSKLAGLVKADYARALQAWQGAALPAAAPAP